jgi:anaerobic selenocysteine-containing dehydrogenase
MDRADAEARGLTEGDTAIVHNDRSSLELPVRISTRLRPGVVVAQSIWWRKLSPDGNNANALTSQALTDLGGGATFYDCLVEAEPVA